MKTAEVIAQALNREGVEVIFTLMGTGNLEVIAALAPTTRIINVRHDSMAVAMADGYARVTGGVGVASVTCGPGLTQIATSLMAARRHRTPVVVFAGDSPAADKNMGGLQDMPQEAFVRASGALFHPVRTMATAVQDVRHAFYLARTRRLPVVLNAPLDVVAKAMPEEPTMTTVPPSPARIVRDLRSAPAPELVARATAILLKSARPIVLVGRGALSPSCRDEVEAFAESIGALLATTLEAKGAFDGSPYDIGLAGGFSTTLARQLFAEADCIVVVGASLSRYTTLSGQLFPNARLVIIDHDPLVGGNSLPTDDACLLISDAALGVHALTAAIRGRDQDDGYRTPEVLARLADDARETEIRTNPVEATIGRVDPRSLMLALDALLPRDCTIVIGCGHFWSFPIMYLSGFRERNFVYTVDFGAIGQGIGVALGVAVASPERTVVVFEGDASALMNVQELETAARHGIRVLLFVLNDQALGSEVIQLKRKGLDAGLAALSTPSFEEVAHAFRLTGSTIRSVSDVPAAYDKFAQSPGTHVIDVRIDSQVVNSTYIGESSDQ